MYDDWRALALLIPGLIFAASVIFMSTNCQLALRWGRPRGQRRQLAATIIVPCHNEATLITDTFRARWCELAEHYDVLLINDGSTDNTWSQLRTLFDLVSTRIPTTTTPFHRALRSIGQSRVAPRLFCVDKVNGGKSDALNAGIALAQQSLVVTIDADTMIAPTDLERLLAPFVDAAVVATGGVVQITSPPHGIRARLLASLQQLEYARGFLVEKLVFGRWGTIGIISGAFGAFRTDVIRTIGGYAPTVGEDIDITLRLHRYMMRHKRARHRIVFVPEALAYTEAPTTLRDLERQRVRWQKAFLDGIRRHGIWFLERPTHRLSWVLLGYMFGISVGMGFATVGYLVVLFWHGVPPLAAFMYLGIGLIVRMFQNLTARRLARRYAVAWAPPWWMYVLDLVVYQWLTLTLVLVGTVAYFVKRGGWDNIARYSSTPTAPSVHSSAV